MIDVVDRHHGIINNEMYDPKLKSFFRYNRPAMSRDSRWWGGEPIWVTAIKQGHASAVLAASIFHFGTYTIAQAHAALRAAGLPARG